MLTQLLHAVATSTGNGCVVCNPDPPVDSPMTAVWHVMRFIVPLVLVVTLFIAVIVKDARTRRVNLDADPPKPDDATPTSHES
jgi:hypothetical protein